MMGVVSLMRGCDDYKVRDWVVSDLCFLSSFPCTGRLLATKYRNVHSLYNIYLLQYCSYVLPWAVTSGLPTLTLLKSHLNVYTFGIRISRNCNKHAYWIGLQTHIIDLLIDFISSACWEAKVEGELIESNSCLRVLDNAGWGNFLRCWQSLLFNRWCGGEERMQLLYYLSITESPFSSWKLC